MAAADHIKDGRCRTERPAYNQQRAAGNLVKSEHLMTSTRSYTPAVRGQQCKDLPTASTSCTVDASMLRFQQKKTKATETLMGLLVRAGAEELKIY